jgi:tRNA threonylcarbamoyladenosine biosynthesis protein TsaB
VIVVGFDTATDDTAVATWADGRPLRESHLSAPAGGRPAHATRLLAEIGEAVESAGGWEEIGRIAVGVGPGSFTGLRIGISTARALGQALRIPAVGVGTLAALARGMAEGAAGRSLLPALDARRGEAFAALYDADRRNEVWAPFVASPEELVRRVSRLPEPPLAAGSGALRFRAELHGCGVEIPGDEDPVHRIAARHICALGAGASDLRDAEITPIYLRPPDAERWRDRDRQ